MIPLVAQHVGEFLVACFLLAVSSYLSIRSLLAIARFLRISEFAAAFILMATATSLPELFVGISSALAGRPMIALGTVIGSNILDLTLIIGIALVASRTLRITSKEIRTDAIWMVALALMPMVLMWIGHGLSRIDGLALISAFLCYEWWVFRKSRRFTKVVANQVGRGEVVVSSGLLLLMLAGMYFSADWVVDSAIIISSDIGMPAILVGVIMIALGTSLPELAFETASAIRRHGDLALGDVIGSVITNSTLVLGVTSVITPISNNFFLFLTSGTFMVAVAVVFAAFTESDRLTWKVGAGLILLYVFFLIVQLEMGNL